jgi:hypothetical protein
VQGISWIEDGLEVWQAAGAMLCVPFSLALKAEALYLADRTSEALEAIKEAERLAETSGERWWCAELHRLHGVFLAAIGADETQIDASFHEAIRIANQQKSISLAKRAEATYAEYRRQKLSASGEHESTGSDYLFANAQKRQEDACFAFAADREQKLFVAPA